jgi:hypothetical protein
MQQFYKFYYLTFCVVQQAPDDGHAGARNMLSDTKLQVLKLVKRLHLVGCFI